MPQRRSKRGMKSRRMAPRRKRTTVNVNRALQPIPQRYICNMKYSDVATLSALNGYNYRFNLNSIFDPNRTGVGFQPYGHDTLQTLYNRYRVIKTSYVITAYSSATAIRVAALPANEEVAPASLSDAVTHPRSKFIIQYPGGNTNKLQGSIHLPSLVGRSKSQYMADDRYQATFGTSPNELAVLNIYGGSLSDVGADIQITVQMTFTVEVFDVKNLAQS